MRDLCGEATVLYLGGGGDINPHVIKLNMCTNTNEGT